MLRRNLSVNIRNIRMRDEKNGITHRNYSGKYLSLIKGGENVFVT
jgi:hypothetical protein